MAKRIVLIILVAGVFSSAFAEENDSSSSTSTSTSTSLKESTTIGTEGDLNPKEGSPLYLICKSKTAVRTLRVEKKPAGKCITTYTKNGADQIVSRSSSFTQCSKVLSNIRENLEKYNWKCKDISGTRVSSSE